MSLYDEVLSDIQVKKERKEKGLYNGIPFPFEKYREYVSSIDKGMYYAILGGTGTGKSRLMRHLFIYEPLKFAMKNAYPVKILYFALEDSRSLTMKKIMIHYLWERHGITLHPKYLDSKDIPLDDKYIDLLVKDSAFYRKFDETVFIINGATTPSEIHKQCLGAYEKYGKSHHIIAIIDNYSNVTRDKHHSTEWDAVRELSRNIIRLDLCKDKNMTVVGILQTDMETEKNTFRNAGKGGIASVEPNLGSIGDVKVVAKDCYNLWALFNPWRYEIKKYPHSEGYNVDILRNRFRSLIHLKNNEGELAPRLGLWFDGLRETFDEMPSVNEKETLEKLYRKIEIEETEKREKLARKSLFN